MQQMPWLRYIIYYTQDKGEFKQGKLPNLWCQLWQSLIRQFQWREILECHR